MFITILNDRDSYLKIGFILFALFLFFLSMEEISWGERLFRIHPPEFIRQNSSHGELNLHNLNTLKWHAVVLQAGIIVWIIILPLFAKKFNIIKISIEKIGIPIVSFSLLPIFFLALYIYLGLSLSDIINAFPKNDELGEMLIGFSLCFVTLDIFLERKKKTSGQTIYIFKYEILLLIVIFIFTTLLVSIKPSYKNIRIRTDEFANRIYPQRNLNQQAEKLFEFEANNPKVRGADTLLNYGLFLKTIGKIEMSTNVLEKAIKEQEEEITNDSSQPEPFSMMGKLYSALGQKELSERNFRLSIKKYEERIKNSSNHDFIAKDLIEVCSIYHYLGDNQSAYSAIKRGLQLKPYNVYTQRRLKEWYEKVKTLL